MKRKLWYFWGNDPGEKHIEIWYIPFNFEERTIGNGT